MALSQILEVALGLVVVYYILGAIVSFITRLITQTLETRGVALEKYLKEALGNKYLDLSELPQVKARRPIGHKNWVGVLTATPEVKKLDKIPAPLLVDAVFDVTGLTGKKDLSPAELVCIVEKLPESQVKRALNKWILQGVTDINELRSRTRDYLCGVLDQAAGTFRVYARSSVIVLSLLITLLLGTDSIQLARDLWNSAELRAMAAAQAEQVVQSQGMDTNISNLIRDLGAYSMRLGWWNPQNFPAAMTAGQLAGFIILKLLGLLITCIAVSQGSSFWYDVLKKLSSRASSTNEAQEASTS